MNLNKTIEEMKALSRSLIGKSFPQTSGENEEILSPLKTREVTVEGYPLILYHSLAQYPEHTLENFQVQSQKTPFLPFYLVTKIARKFLGDEHLSLVDIYANNKKVYIWTKASNLDGTLRPTLEEMSEPMEYQGFKFHRLNPKQVNFL